MSKQAKPKFKSDARPSDTKSVVLHKENDRRLLDHLARAKRESAFWRAAGYFYLDFMAWLEQIRVTQPDAPAPGQEFIHYQRWLEGLPSPPGTTGGRAGGEGLDPESISAAVLPGVRAVVEAALATALAGLSVAAQAAPVEELDLVDLFSPAELVLE